MNGWQRMVREFHAKFGQPIVDRPNAFIPMSREVLRFNLMKEELEETRVASMQDDIIEIADGLADLIYVALGTAIEYGIDLEPVFAEVHRSNMEKIPGLQRADGKITKPPGWKPPRIKEILDAQSEPDEWPKAT